jgi:DnaJ-domain-containing protein 1
MPTEQDHYATLGLPRKATADEIKRRYRALMRRTHPDANAAGAGDDPAKATRAAARINAAYETLGDPAKRREYDARTRGRANGRRNDKTYAYWAEQPDWEDIVAEHALARRPPHEHSEEPVIEPEEIEVDLAELRISPRVRRRIVVTNRCECTIKGDVSTSEPWVWGPMGRYTLGPGERVEFDIEIVGSRIRFPGISRVSFVGNTWSGTVPVKLVGFETKRSRVVPLSQSRYVPPRRPRAGGGRIR